MRELATIEHEPHRRTTTELRAKLAVALTGPCRAPCIATAQTWTSSCSPAARSLLSGVGFGGGRRYAVGMATTVKVDFDGDLLAKLRARRPGKDDRTLLEEMARIELGFETLAEVQRRNALSEEEATDLAVRAVREVRAELR